MPLSATRAALSTTERRETEVPVLTDVSFLDTVRAQRGDRVLEVAAPVYNVSRERIGTVRIGISLARVAQEVRAAMGNAILLGVVAARAPTPDLADQIQAALPHASLTNPASI